MTIFAYHDQELFCEQVALNQLVQEFGTPLYVYSSKALTDNYLHYKNNFSSLNPMICYAVKANGNLSILKHFADLGAGFDIVSGGELARVLAAGGKAEQIIFSGVGKTVAEMEFALQNNIFCFNVESVNELHRLNTVALKMGKKAPISLRVNPDVDAKTHPYISTGLKENKFGIPFEDALSTYLQAQQLPGLEIIGVDCHVGSQLLDAAPLIEACEKLLNLVEQLQDKNIQLKHIDMGGGIGIQYEQNDPAPSLSDYAEALASKLENYNLELILEPGRSLVGNTGVLLTNVEYIKKNQDKNFIIVDAAMNDLARPALYDAFHEIIPVKLDSSASSLTADIVGPICESSDFLGKNRTLTTTEGEVLAIKDTGAYGTSMASNYNARPRGAEVLVDGKNYHLIRSRETLSQLIENEKCCL